MSITLDYNDDISRVTIEVDGLSPGTYTIERSVNEFFWRPVRGGLHKEPSSGSINLSDYEFQSDVENFYRVLDDQGSVEEEDSITPSLDGLIWLKSIRHPFLNRTVNVTDFSDRVRSSRGGVFEVKGRSVPVSTTDIRASHEFTLEAVTETPAESLVMDLVLASGGVMFVHTPAGCAVPGGHVFIGDVTEIRRSTRGSRRYFTLPCRLVSEPGPDVVGGTMTYGALLNLFGGYDNLLSSNTEYADLLDLMANPEDLVVL